MDSASLAIIVTAYFDQDLLHTLFPALFIFSLDILYLHFIDSQTVYPLSRPLNHASLFHKKLVSLIPVLPLMHVDVESDSFLFEPQNVTTLGELAQLKVVDSMLVTRVDNEFPIGEGVLDVNTRRRVDLEELEVGRLQRGVLEGESHSLGSQKGQILT
jgi:hypothetical protein